MPLPYEHLRQPSPRPVIENLDIPEADNADKVVTPHDDSSLEFHDDEFHDNDYSPVGEASHHSMTYRSRE